MKKHILFLTLTIFSISLYGQIDITLYGADPGNQANDDSDAIQAAIDFTYGTDGIPGTNDDRLHTIFFPAGWYRVEKPIIIKGKVELVGEGSDGITIFQPSDCSGFIIESSGVVIKNMQILGRKDALNMNDGKYHSAIVTKGEATGPEVSDITKQITNCRFENLKIFDIAIGLELKYTWKTKINNVDIYLNPEITPNLKVLEGIRFYGKCVNNTISNCSIEANTYCVSMYRDVRYKDASQYPAARSEGIMITNSLLALGNSAIYSEGVLSLNVSNSILDLCKDYTVNLTNAAAVMLSNNWIFSSRTAPAPLIDEGIHLNACWDVHISNNTIVCNTGVRGISINGSNNVTVLGNTINMSNISENSQSIFINNSSSKNIIKNNTIRNHKLNENGIKTPTPSRIIIEGNDNIVKDNLFAIYFNSGNNNQL